MSFKFFGNFFKKIIAAIWKSILKAVWPPVCISCGRTIFNDQDFCLDCQKHLRPIKKPHCVICSFPFEVDLPSRKPICGSCLKKKPSFDQVIAEFVYEPTIGRAISSLKYRDEQFLAKHFAAFLAQKAKNEISDCDIITSVPLHPKKLQKRKFNQAALIASKLSKTKVNNQLLWRVAEKSPQVGLTQKQRQQNLGRAFLVNKSYRDCVKDKKILLIDDVMTTGSTLNSCAKELKRRKAKSVICLVIAKTVF